MTLGLAGSGNHQFALFADGTAAGDPIRAQTRTTAASSAASTTGYAINTWQHAVGVFASATDRRVYLNGGSVGANSTSRIPVGIDATYIGTGNAITLPNSPMAGRIAEAGIWNVELNTSEIAALAKGVSPLRIRPNALVAYWPLYGVGSPEPDYSNGGFHLTLTAAPTQVDHAPVMPAFYRADWFGAFAEAAAPAAGHSLVLGDNLSNRIFGGLVVR